MNKLPKAITATFFNNTEANYTALVAHWRMLVNSKRKSELKPEHHLIYQALRGKDWRKGFRPVTNSVKLANGGYDNWGLTHVLNRISYLHRVGAAEMMAPFDGLVTLEMLVQVKALLPKSSYIPDRTQERLAEANMLLEAYVLTAAQEDLIEAAKQQKALVSEVAMVLSAGS